jgi:subtilisin family serine protease
MSTEDQNKCVVTVKKGVDVDALMEELTSIGSTTEYVPHRAVEMYNEKQDSLRNFDIILTKDEAERLKLDSRIVDVRYGTKVENGFILRPSVLDESRTYSRSTTQNASHYNLAFYSCTRETNPWTVTSATYQLPYTAIGEGVDVVIQDSGIEIGHPEWLAQDGVTSRLKLIDWPSAAGLSGLYTQPANHYRDLYGHGTHCAGTVAGRRNGWAKAADIYAIKMLEDPGNEFAIGTSFNLIRNWHNNKTNGRPTVVNMSWGYLNFYTNIVSGVYRGTPWTGTTIQSQYGMIQNIYTDYYGDGTVYYHPIRVASVDAEIEDCLDAGIILVAAAGNDTHKIDVPGGLDYDNYFSTSGGATRYYHRGATPSIPGVINVGAMRASSTEYKSAFSCCGPGVTVYAPGEAIQSAMPVGASLSSGAVNHPDNANFKLKKIQGTSMAAPQVAGVLACLLGSRPHYDNADCIKWLEKTTIKNRILDTGSTNYTDLFSLQGSPNRYLRYPFSQPATGEVLKVNRT